MERMLATAEQLVTVALVETAALLVWALVQLPRVSLAWVAMVASAEPVALAAMAARGTSVRRELVRTAAMAATAVVVDRGVQAMSPALARSPVSTEPVAMVVMPVTAGSAAAVGLAVRQCRQVDRVATEAAMARPRALVVWGLARPPAEVQAPLAMAARGGTAALAGVP